MPRNFGSFVDHWSTRVSKSIYLLTDWHRGLVFIGDCLASPNHFMTSVLIFAETQE